MGWIIRPEKDRTLLELLRAAGETPECPCGGSGRCGNCRVRVLRGKVTPVTEEEKLRLPRELRAGVRLACQTVPLEEVDVEPLEDLRTEAAPARGERSWTPPPPGGNGYGLAVDLGTTTVAAALVELDSRLRRAEAGFLNPQRAYGADVISRIQYQLEHPGDGALREVLLRRLRRSVEELAQAAGTAPEKIRAGAVSGNPTMVHLLLGASVEGLGRAPYRCALERPVTAEASGLGLPLAQGAELYCLPHAGPFLGGDAVAGALAAGLDRTAETVLLLDLGTNGELILSRGGRLYGCSCAAGPALEGMGLSCGMRAGPGAVEHVGRTAEGFSLTVIGGGAPRGLCGSGVLDAVSQGVAVGVLAPNGRLREMSPFTRRAGDGTVHLVLDRAGELILTQEDVRQVQLCKGAIRSGLQVLLNRAGITAEAVDRVLVAGQFGGHLAGESLIGVACCLPAWKSG